jgi:hypothetical protein
MIHSAICDKNLCGLWAFLHPFEKKKNKIKTFEVKIKRFNNGDSNHRLS